MTRGRLEAVLFDAVGTLIRLREPVGVTYARFARRLGLQAAPDALQAEFLHQHRRRHAPVFPGRSVDECRDLERSWWRDLVHAVFAAVEPETRLDGFDAIFAELFAHYGGAAAWETAAGGRALLLWLRERSLHTAVVSNFDYRLHEVLRQLGLRPLLDAVVLPADAGAAKPDAAIFACALHRLGVRAAAALYVGDDAEEDVAAARAAGLSAVLIDDGGDLAGVRRAIAEHTPRTR